MYETETMRNIDALLLELDSLAYGPMVKPQLQAISDGLAQAWEAHRGEVLRPGASRLLRPFQSSEVKSCQGMSTPMGR